MINITAVKIPTHEALHDTQQWIGRFCLSGLCGASYAPTGKHCCSCFDGVDGSSVRQDKTPLDLIDSSVTGVCTNEGYSINIPNYADVFV